MGNHAFTMGRNHSIFSVYLVDKMNPYEKLIQLQAENELKKQTPEYQAGKIFLFGLVIGFLAGLILAYTIPIPV